MKGFLLGLAFSLLGIKSAFGFDVLAFGDSITQGLQRNSSNVIYACTSRGNGRETSCGYGDELEAFLARAGYPSRVFNWGYSGERTCCVGGNDGLSRIDSVLNSRNADFILIMEGANDLYQGLSSSTTKSAISAMVDKARAKNVTPIIATITPNTARGLGFDSQIRRSYNPKIRDLAREKTVLIADQYDAVAGGWRSVPYNSGDGLHVSNRGYQKIAGEWFRVFESQDFFENKPNITPILNLLLLD